MTRISTWVLADQPSPVPMAKSASSEKRVARGLPGAPPPMLPSRRIAPASDRLCVTASIGVTSARPDATTARVHTEARVSWAGSCPGAARDRSEAEARARRRSAWE